MVVKATSVLFVCLGNICRSPTADGVFRQFVANEALDTTISVDSAGTSDWHIGAKPDGRTIVAASKRGYDLSYLRGRQVCAEDFQIFDYILAMDKDNLSELEHMRPAEFSGHLGLFLAFGSRADYREVPDPYHGGERGFELVLDLVEDACANLLERIRRS